ncbi:hypothetical protein EJ05DRAFT_47222 [Pseudovirgaria hyperparasitica]|uniref:Uncharacterized protein n=1 Tax=Pseudovirgaria hyperparasitica TaxID=470096 RepID=A0A6A6W2V8_9PEZI|nr:uncharacterized protein EJ05DRAFT_47222 [Pseudovirgaria hyperparasitica]KAF2756895.1 hypothetical protein EJ05DRAFT_47222 [Pseudovirgaria hyperparasitica]
MPRLKHLHRRSVSISGGLSEFFFIACIVGLAGVPNTMHTCTPTGPECLCALSRLAYPHPVSSGETARHASRSIMPEPVGRCRGLFWQGEGEQNFTFLFNHAFWLASWAAHRGLTRRSAAQHVTLECIHYRPRCSTTKRLSKRMPCLSIVPCFTSGQNDVRRHATYPSIDVRFSMPTTGSPFPCHVVAFSQPYLALPVLPVMLVMNPTVLPAGISDLGHYRAFRTWFSIKCYEKHSTPFSTFHFACTRGLVGGCGVARRLGLHWVHFLVGY